MDRIAYPVAIRAPFFTVSGWLRAKVKASCVASARRSGGAAGRFISGEKWLLSAGAFMKKDAMKWSAPTTATMSAAIRGKPQVGHAEKVSMPVNT